MRASLSRFVAIFAIVALGVGFLSGLLAAPVDMRLSADEYCREANLYDIKIQSTQGLTDEDLAAVRAVEGVSGVMPARDMDLVLTSESGESLTTRLQSIPEEDLPEADRLNQLTLVEGRMPSAPGEIAVGLTKDFSGTIPAIGDVLTVNQTENDENVTDALPQTFTVVGTVRSAAYFSVEAEYTNTGTGTIGLFAYAPESCFDMDYYTTFYLPVEGAKELNSFSAAYEDKVDGVMEGLEAIQDERVQARYEEIIDEAEAELDDAWAEYEEKKAEAEQELANAAQELEDGWAKLADAEQELADAKLEIDRGQAELDDGKDEFYRALPGYKQQIADGYSKLESSRAQLDSAQTQLDEGRAQLDQLSEGKAAFWTMVETQINPLLTQYGLPPIDTSDQSDAATITAIEQVQTLVGLAPSLPEGFDPAQLEQLGQLKEGLEALAAQGTTLGASLAALDEKQAEIDAGRRQIEDGLSELQAQERQLEKTKIETENQFAVADEKLLDARQQYADGLAELEEGRQELIDGQKEYEDAKAEAEQELADGKEEILDAESEVREIEKGKWLLGDRSDNTSFSSYGDNADKIAAIATVFPVFFFLVAALVALTTMTRMVEEERGQVGTMKALGYTRGQIAAKYILYALTASLAGSGVGMLIGMQLFPRIILSAYNIMYDLPDLLTPFNWGFGLLATGAAVACTLLATLNACWAELREQPASLMLPKAPKAGKRILLEHIGPVWRRLRFTHKVTARNLFLYKKRFFMTVVGIAGCTALLVTGFGLQDSISDIVEKQFDELAHYQMLVSLQDESALDGRDLAVILNDETKVTGHLAVSQQDATVVPEEGGEEDNLYIVVPSDTEAMTEYFTFRQRTTGETVPFEEGSVVISEKLAERHDLSVGDSITVENADGDKASFTITGVCENYIYHYLYMSEDVYRDAFGEGPETNLLYCRLAEGVDTPEAEDELATALLKCRDIAGAQFTHEITASFRQSLDSINYIVVVLIIAAGALAFVVLYNLTNINITERSKELATIKVLGFYDGEVGAYIYRETSVLTLIGTVCGLVFGIALHTFVIRTAEVDMVMFGRSIYPMSFVWSALLTIAFSLLVNLVMYRKLKNISMVESMKAPE
ncbi:FtsX-like permease family protein [Candidatus Allofournierella merdipullorum]|uniref:FtsX-like permease family protein n=1 Tax=Candidatus Allofournierella merdipullorum TaxID=2838595 RepID=UPI002A8C3614|nr:FtsX-like permease family protein [Candidatus Fournierella merdipullorum]